MGEFNIIIILGPTASGKTKLAASLAYRLDTEIISADSRQVYREMNIGTGKDYVDYIINEKQIPCHLIDIVDAGADYNLHRYMQDFQKVFDQVTAKNKIPLWCGGTGLYMDALINAYAYSSVPVNDELRHELKDKSGMELKDIFHALPITKYRPLADTSTNKRLIRAIEISNYLLNNTHTPLKTVRLKPLIFGMLPDREWRTKQIESRLIYRLKNGLISEVEQLLNKGIPESKLMFYGLEYRFVTMYLNKEISFSELQSKLSIAIRQFAKRQMTFFRKMERNGLKIHWINASLPLNEQIDFAMQLINQSGKI